MDRPDNRCKHGMIKDYCATCKGKTSKPAKATGRGVGRIFADIRPMNIWIKEES